MILIYYGCSIVFEGKWKGLFYFFMVVNEKLMKVVRFMVVIKLILFNEKWF